MSATQKTGQKSIGCCSYPLQSDRLPPLMQQQQQQQKQQKRQKHPVSQDQLLPRISSESAGDVKDAQGSRDCPRTTGSYLRQFQELLSLRDGDVQKMSLSGAQRHLEMLQDISEEWRKVDPRYQRARAKFDFLLSNVIGCDAVFVGPYGLRRLLYCDFVASGRSLHCVEDFIQSAVLPSYGNTHSNGSLVAMQTNSYREEARRIIKKCVNAGPDDALIFTGSGVTGAVQTLIGVLELQERSRRGQRVSVVCGPFEHHSNLLPWREFADVCVQTPLDAAGGVDMTALAATLKKFRAGDRGSSDNQLLIGTFSAASNVTGALTDTDAVTALLHSHGAIAVWDFACAASHVTVNMNSGGNSSFDALLLSPHKFPGGPGTPGVLVAKRRLFANRVPHRSGGGTVEFVTKDAHQYDSDIETREEGGTPAIIDCIRCGLVFRVKRETGDAEIEDREAELLRWAWEVFPTMETVLVLGNRQLPRLAVFSFLVANRETGLFLHHNFVSILLNDLYGVQSRAGCACAGPYAADLLNFDRNTQKRFPYLVNGINRLKYCIDNYPKMKEQGRQKSSSSTFEELEVFKPGFVRINLPYFYTNEMIAFLFEAIDMISRHGWKLLPEYDCDPHTGAWKHRRFKGQIRRLTEFRIDLARTRPDVYRDTETCQSLPSLKTIAESAKKVLLLSTEKGLPGKRIPNVQVSVPGNTSGVAPWERLIESQRKMRWFALPHEATASEAAAC